MKFSWFILLVFLSSNSPGQDRHGPEREKPEGIYRVTAVRGPHRSASNEVSTVIVQDLSGRVIRTRPLQAGFYIVYDKGHHFKLFVNGTGQNSAQKFPR